MSAGCEVIEAALSAQADGEDPGIEPDVLEAHVARCSSCQAFARRTEDLRRRMRVRPAPAVPDLAARIKAGIPSGPAPCSRWRGQRTLSAPGLAIAAAAVVIILMGAFLGGRLLAGNGSGGSNSRVTQVAGSNQTNPNYPGAVVPGVTFIKPDITLTDTSNQPYNIATDTAGRVTLVYFGYTHCPDVCPINMQLTADALKMMPASERDRITVVFVTTDPARDTPSVIRAWLNNFSPTFVGVTGSITQIHQAEKDVGMPLSIVNTAAANGSYTITHAGYTLAYSQDNLAHMQIDVTETPKDYAQTLEHLVAHGFQVR